MSFYCTKQATVRRKLDNGSLFYVSFPESRRPVFVPCEELCRGDSVSYCSPAMEKIPREQRQSPRQISQSINTRLKRPIAHAVSLISTRDTEWALSIQKHHQNTSKEKTNAMSSLSN